VAAVVSHAVLIITNTSVEMTTTDRWSVHQLTSTSAIGLPSKREREKRDGAIEGDRNRTMTRTITGLDCDRILMKTKYKRFWRKKTEWAVEVEFPSFIRTVVETTLSEIKDR
jgi:hypothetical protein